MAAATLGACSSPSGSSTKPASADTAASDGSDSSDASDDSDSTVTSDADDGGSDAASPDTADSSACKPLCDGISCGDDGCGGSCGCAADQQCQNKFCVANPCGTVPASGKCLGTGKYAVCTAATGSGTTPVLSVTSCELYEVCDESGGFATCTPKPGSCLPGTEECKVGAADTVRICNPEGQFVDAACASCQATGLAGTVACPGSVGLTSQTVSITYDYVAPWQGYTGYAEQAPLVMPAIFVVVIAGRYDAEFKNLTVFDAQTTSGQGKATLKLPVGAAADAAHDVLLLVASGVDFATGKVRYAVAEPASTEVQLDTKADTQGKVYSWAAYLAALPSSDLGMSWHISSAKYSDVLQAFDAFRYIYEVAHWTLYNKVGKSLVLWLRHGSDFSCGACFAAWPSPANVAGLKADSQMFLSSSTKTAYSGAVMAHETGHWLINSYGWNPNEGGSHYFLTKVPPGMAWSEGWSTFFSSMVRGNSVYFSSGSDGSMFWLNLDGGDSSAGKLPLPFVAAPLLQFMDENRVAWLLWHLASEDFGGFVPQEPLKAPASKKFWQALASKQMTDGVFTAGYYRQTWESVKLKASEPNGAIYTKLTATSEPAPTLVDFLTALECQAPAVAAAIDKFRGAWPYETGKPTCKPN